MKEICDVCIWILEQWSKELGISYAAINIWLFIILQPLLIVFGCWSTIKCANTKNEKLKNKLKWISISILILGVIFGIFVVMGFLSYGLCSDLDCLY